MKYQKDYSTRRSASIALFILMVMVAMFVVFESRTEPEKTWDIECPMANAKISWQQSFHSGAMEVGQ